MKLQPRLEFVRPEIAGSILPAIIRHYDAVGNEIIAPFLICLADEPTEPWEKQADQAAHDIVRLKREEHG